MSKNNINYSKLNFDFEYKNRLVKCVNENNEHVSFNTPLLKVLKPIHITTNKKKNLERKYIILEINDKMNTNSELDEIIIIINKLHECSQENISKNSIKWFNTEFDEYGLDSKIKRPIDSQKDRKFIKILISNENNELLEKINTLEKDDYISTYISYKGLKVYSDHLIGEYELLDFLTQEEEENKTNKNINEIINDEIDEDFINELNEGISNKVENEIEIKNIENNEKLNEKTIEKIEINKDETKINKDENINLNIKHIENFENEVNMKNKKENKKKKENKQKKINKDDISVSTLNTILTNDIISVDKQDYINKIKNKRIIKETNNKNKNNKLERKMKSLVFIN